MTALDLARTALSAVLSAPDLGTAKAAAQAGFDKLDAKPRRFLPLKQAMHKLDLKDRQMRRWMKADEAEGISVFTRGRWYIDVEAAAAKRRGRK